MKPSTDSPWSVEVDGNLVFFGSTEDDSLTISGNVGRSVLASTFGGKDEVSISGAVTGGLALDTGLGDDTVTLSNAVGGKVAIFTGAGDDNLTDTFTLDDSVTIATLLANGGTGADVFNGTAGRTGLTLVSFP